MAKVITGTADKKKADVAKVIRNYRDPNPIMKDPRQTRCLKCRQGLAVQVPDGKGGFMYQCPQCYAKFAFTQM